jgi:hypothetical protein
VPREALGQTLITLRPPRRDITSLERFARCALPKAASNAAVLDRVLRVLNAAV